jgi:hypothetical protein
MMITPWPPLPAGTLLGTIGLCTLMVNWGETASTARLCEGVLWVVDGPVPVMVMV